MASGERGVTNTQKEIRWRQRYANLCKAYAQLQRGLAVHPDLVAAQCLEQTVAYADAYKADEAHLVIFNRDPDVGWDKKIWQRPETRETRTIRVWGA